MSLEGEHQSAARLMGAAEALREFIFVAVEPLDDDHDRRVERVRASLDEPTFAAGMAVGWLMTLEQAIAYALEAHTPPTEQAGKSETASPASPSLPEPLNARELEVLSLVASGLSNREIAGQLFLTVNTVKWYLKGIFGKLQVANRTQAVAHGERWVCCRRNRQGTGERRNQPRRIIWPAAWFSLGVAGCCHSPNTKSGQRLSAGDRATAGGT